MVQAKPTAFDQHDHSDCNKNALSCIDTYCSENKLRLTDARKHVFEILLEANHPLGAYDVLSHLKSRGYQQHPPVAYRALDFLTDIGFAHRIECMNSYVACSNPEHPHRPVFMICDCCKHVTETNTNFDCVMKKEADAANFTLKNFSIEIEGTCSVCSKASKNG